MAESRGCGAQIAGYIVLMSLMIIGVGGAVVWQKLSPEDANVITNRLIDFVYMFVALFFIALVSLIIARISRRADPSPPQHAQAPPNIYMLGGGAQPWMPQQPALPDYGGFRDRNGHEYDEPLGKRRWTMAAPRVIGEPAHESGRRRLPMATESFGDAHPELLDDLDGDGDMDAILPPDDSSPAIDRDAIGYDLIDGMSIRQASLKHFGYEGGTAYRVVSEIAEELNL